MSPEQVSRLRYKQWLLKANATRPPVSKAIAGAIGKPTSAITFTDMDETGRISGVFGTQLHEIKDTEFPNRKTALQFVVSELSGITGPAFLLVPEFDYCGAVTLDFSEAIANIDPLLQSQHEFFRLISFDGNAGVCMHTQEGPAPQHPRYVTLWRA